MVPGLETAGKALIGFETPNPHFVLEVINMSQDSIQSAGAIPGKVILFPRTNKEPKTSPEEETEQELLDIIQKHFVVPKNNQAVIKKNSTSPDLKNECFRIAGKFECLGEICSSGNVLDESGLISALYNEVAKLRERRYLKND